MTALTITVPPGTSTDEVDDRLARSFPDRCWRSLLEHRPRSAVLLLSRVMLETFAGTPLAKHWEGAP